MLILSRVCADFYDRRNTLLFRISPQDLGLFVDAPESIREDPLFRMLVDDGSIKFPEDAKSNRALENDPYAGATAEGKEIKDEGEVTPNQVIPPTDAAFTLPEAGVASASAKKDGAFTTYTLKLKEESSTIANPVPTYNSQAIGYLKMTDMEVPGATITDANMHYPGSTVTVTVDSQNRVRQLQLHLPMDGNGSAKMGFLSGTASFEGYSTQNWTFTY